jgi:uncharacterized protein (DUF1800 family)
VRATGIAGTSRPLIGVLQQLGMPLYGCVTPDGYKNTADVWLNPDAMTRRVSFATALASGRLPALDGTKGKQATLDSNQLPGLALPPIDAVQLSATLGHAFSGQTQQAIAASPPNLRAALILGSPEFMRR